VGIHSQAWSYFGAREEKSTTTSPRKQRLNRYEGQMGRVLQLTPAITTLHSDGASSAAGGPKVAETKRIAARYVSGVLSAEAPAQ